MTFAVLAVGWLISVGAAFLAENETARVGEKVWVEGFEIVFGDSFGIVFVFGIKAFFESVVHGVDGDFSLIVTVHGVDVLFLEEEEGKEECGKN